MDKSVVMQEWYFSKDGELLGPLTLTESIAFVQKYPNTYAWQPNYTHWLPVSDIAAFKMALSPPPPPHDVPQDLIDSLSAKETALNTSLSRIESALQTIDASLDDLDRDTTRSKDKTQHLNEQVAATIKSISEQYKALQKTLADASNS
ncbi:GYF domain-containing protein [Shewanella maritima]|uniref:DUF4339 domain-containing protein n=1 Tax=Shewanella maritima TaxID=2520507 RepID=UPI003735AF0A